MIQPLTVHLGLALALLWVVPAYAQPRWNSIDLGAHRMVATGVNDTGTVVGETQMGLSGFVSGFVWTAEAGPVLTGDFIPADVNNGGTLVGSYLDAPAMWAPGQGIVTLGPAGFRGHATSVNNAGQIAGCGRTAGASSDRAFIWSSATGLVDLGTLGGAGSCARALNEAGAVVGDSDSQSGRIHAFIKVPDQPMVDLHQGPLNTYGRAWDINNHGVVVGEMDGRAFRWTATTGAEWLSSSSGIVATAINDAGQIIGQLPDVASSERHAPQRRRRCHRRWW